MDIWWTLHLKRDPASVPLARRILLGAMDSAGVDPQVAFDLGVALTEACANAVEHTGPARPGDTFQVTAALSGNRLRIEVTDTGPGLPATCATADPPAPRRPTGVPGRARPATPRRTRRGRATLPPRVLTAARRPTAYDTHVLPPGRPHLPAPAPDTVPDLTAECGRGLFLIHALTDHVQLRNHPLRGATVSFDKILTWRDDTPLLRSA
ncbi:ATP-binding protein [Kitasatospora sp. NPDC049285]|uniref:ATP-binding protein n=1 Tax=Kitasatospora sp. NPDC049285 TaxID=3157096 RepID=UPI00341A15E8